MPASPSLTLKPLDLQASALVSSVSLVQEKLDRVRAKIIKENLVNGKLEPEFQLAVRIIESRKRELQRHLLIGIRPPNDPDRLLAEAELRMTRRDTGDIFRWGFKSHAYGRIGCPGCEYDYRQDALMGLPVKVIQSKVCTQCHKGVMHSQVVESPTEAREAALAFWQVVGLSGMVGRDVGATAFDAGALVMACEACGYMEVTPCS